MNKSNFNEFRFKGFKVSERSNKYLQISSRTSDTGDKIIVRFAADAVFPTRYGYGLRIDHDKGIWLKSWQASKVWDELVGYVYEIILDKNFTKIEQFKESDDIFVTANSNDPEDLRATVDANGIIVGREREYLAACAKVQEATPVIWAK